MTELCKGPGAGAHIITIISITRITVQTLPPLTHPAIIELMFPAGEAPGSSPLSRTDPRQPGDGYAAPPSRRHPRPRVETHEAEGSIVEVLFLSSPQYGAGVTVRSAATARSSGRETWYTSDSQRRARRPRTQDEAVRPTPHRILDDHSDRQDTRECYLCPRSC